MNQEIRKSILAYIEAILTLKGWKNIGEVILLDDSLQNRGKHIDDYVNNMQQYEKIMEEPNFNLLLDTINCYSNALQDDWLPDYIIGLPIPKAYLFLKDIREIILTSEDKDIENDLIEARNKYVDDE